MANKYYSKKVTVDGETFDSKKEYSYYCSLLVRQELGVIRNVRRQVKFVLIPTQREEPVLMKRTGKLKEGRVIERECSYIADFVYEDVESGKTVVVDTKGFKTKDYIIKRKLMLYLLGIRIKEV